MQPVPSHAPMSLLKDASESLSRSDLIVSLAYLKIASRTRNAVLGGFWNVAGFGLFVFGIALLWSTVFDMDREGFVPYVALGYFIFQLANLMMLDGSRSIMDGGNFALQNRIPITLLPFVAVAKQCINAVYALPTVLLALLLYSDSLPVSAWLAIPGFIVCVLTFSGIATVLAILCVFVSDLAELLSSVMRFMFFLTPVMWLVEERSGLHVILLANPLHHAINIVRGPVLGMPEVGLSFAFMFALMIASWGIAAILYQLCSRGVMLRV